MTIETHPSRTVSYTYPQNTASGTTRTDTYNGVSTTTNIGGNGLETSRVSTGAGVGITRAINSRDAGGRETQVTIGANTFYAEYDSAGRLERQWGAGMAAPSKPLSPTYNYNIAGQKSSESLPLAYGGATVTLSNSYTYNLTDRLAGANGTVAYGYDASGNIMIAGTASFAYGADNRLTQIKRPIGTDEVTYNALGQRISEGPASGFGKKVLTYTGTGRLASFDTSNVAGVDGTYTYDAAGQRKTSVVKDSAGRITTTEWVYDGIQLLWYSATRTDGATWNVTYLYDGAGMPYAGIYTGSDTGGAKMPFYFVTTDRGDVVSLLATDGTPFAFYRYDAWGNTTASSSQAVTLVSAPIAASIAERQILRYAGYVWDAESKTYYCSARQYDPVTMQFLSRDIAKADGEESAYQYCAGDPVNATDSTGMWARDVHFGQYGLVFGTRYWVEWAGIKPGHAGSVAKANQDVDEWYTSAATVPQLHFKAHGALDYFGRRINGAIQLWKDYNKYSWGRALSLEALGHALHALQDCHAHLDWHIPRDGIQHWSLVHASYDRNGGNKRVDRFDDVLYDVYRTANGKFRHVGTGTLPSNNPRYRLTSQQTMWQVTNRFIKESGYW